MSKSEIFDRFTKIAQEKGLVSSEKSRKILEETSRADSLSPDDIKKLYQVKNNPPKGMDYKNNIMEIAHKDSVIAGPSYDKLNGLVENNIERQNILLHIVNKRNDGLLVQRKYAQKELILSLVKIANDMDNKDKNKLRTLADTCLSQAKLQKKAAVPVALIAGIVTALAGAFYIQQHVKNFNQGYKNNYRRLREAIDNILNEDISMGFGYKFTDDCVQMMRKFAQKISKFDQMYQIVSPYLMSIKEPKTRDELNEFVKTQNPEILVRAYVIINNYVNNMIPYLNDMKDFFTEENKANLIEDRGFATGLIDQTQILHGGKGLISDQFDKLVQAIPAYQSSLLYIAKELEKAKEYELKATENLSGSLDHIPEIPDDNKPALGLFTNPLATKNPPSGTVTTTGPLSGTSPVSGSLSGTNPVSGTNAISPLDMLRALSQSK